MSDTGRRRTGGTAIDATRWPAVKAHFTSLADLAPAAQAAALAAIDETDLREEVRSLLHAAAAVGARFDRAPVLRTLDSEVRDEPFVGRRIGVWRLIRLLGEGGMGAVYEAVHDEAGFTKRAALKMIVVNRLTPALVARFEAERRILAQLEHRNIAALLDGGVDADGRPWFALEFVEGERLDDWCRNRQLDLPLRVQLFRQACAAVQYAHERLIVHRDLKPANILVAADGTVKLLDFGIAKLADQHDSPLTLAGQAPMTAAYASPEQRDGGIVTTRADIYSLGVVLYELLTGARPFGSGSSSDATPEPPSRRVTAAAGPGVGASTDPATQRRMRRQLHGELDAIVLMALRPEPERRYRSAQELSDDLQRWLDGRPVRAQPDTLGYRTRSFVRRNRMAVAGLVLAVVALVGGTVSSLRQAAMARAERDRARAEQARTERVTQFFQQVLSAAEPRAGAPGLTVIEALDRAVPLIDSAFAGEPHIKASVQLSVGSTLQNLFLAEQARPLLESAYAWFRTHDGATPSREQVDALWDLATLAASDGRLDDAEAMFRRTMTLYEQLPGDDSTSAVSALARIAAIRGDRGDLAASVATYDSVLTQAPQRSRTDSLAYAVFLGSRGSLRAALGALAGAADDFAVAIAINERLLGRESFVVAEALQPYAGTLLFLGRTADAEAAARRGLSTLERLLGSRNPKTLAMQRMLATILVTDDRCSEALPLLRAPLALRGSAALPESDPTIGHALLHLGYCEARLGRPAVGVPLAREGLTRWREMFGERHYARYLAASLTGATLGFAGTADAPEAETLLQEGVAGLRRTLDPVHPRVSDAEARLARFRSARRTPE